MVCKIQMMYKLQNGVNNDLFLFRFLSSLFAPVEMTRGRLALVGMNLLKTND